MTPFRYDGESFVSHWDPFEISVFAGVAGSVISVLQGGARHNPAKQRLLPPLSKDKDVSSEFERLAGGQITDAKVKSLETFQTKLVTAASDFIGDDDDEDLTNAKITLALTRADIQPMLQALTAIRTYLAEILGIETDEDSERIYDLLSQAPMVSTGSTAGAHSSTAGGDSSTAGGGETVAGGGETVAPDNEDLQRERFFASTFAAAGFIQETLLEALMAQPSSS